MPLTAEKSAEVATEVLVTATIQRDKALERMAVLNAQHPNVKTVRGVVNLAVCAGDDLTYFEIPPSFRELRAGNAASFIVTALGYSEFDQALAARHLSSWLEPKGFTVEAQDPTNKPWSTPQSFQGEKEDSYFPKTNIDPIPRVIVMMEEISGITKSLRLQALGDKQAAVTFAAVSSVADMVAQEMLNFTYTGKQLPPEVYEAGLEGYLRNLGFKMTRKTTARRNE